jgi:hypothetical protein
MTRVLRIEATEATLGANVTGVALPKLSPDAQRLTAIQGLVDLDDFLTFWAAEGIVGHWDGYADDQNNFWFYIANQRTSIVRHRRSYYVVGERSPPGNDGSWKFRAPIHVGYSRSTG